MMWYYCKDGVITCDPDVVCVVKFHDRPVNTRNGVPLQSDVPWTLAADERGFDPLVGIDAV